MAIRILADSASDLTPVQAQNAGIEILPIHVYIDDKEYRDGIDIDGSMLYAAMGAQKEVKTAQVSLGAFKEKFEDYADSGDTVVYFSFSGGISGTYQTAVLAKEEICERHPQYDLQVIDTKLVLTGLSMFLLEAATLVRKGGNMDMLLSRLHLYQENMLMRATVEDLRYLVKGGRLSNAQAFVGNLLKIKPVISMKDGILLAVDKVRGNKKYYKYVLEEIKARIPKNKDVSEHVIGISHCDNLEAVVEIKALFQKHTGISRFLVSDTSCAVGAHLGPGGVAIFYGGVLSEFLTMI